MRAQRQPALKPQDVLVLLKLVVASPAGWSFSSLAKELSMSASEVHAAVKRAALARLVAPVEDQWTVVKPALLEFIEHGIRYAFPPVLGALTRGLPTGSFAPPLNERFTQGQAIPTVWPDPAGEVRGVSLLPLYSTAVEASRADRKLYELLAVTDAIRIGAARERELAVAEIVQRLS
jgi:hypothetical protein